MHKKKNLDIYIYFSSPMLYSGFKKALAVKSSVRNMSTSDKVATHSDNRSHRNNTRTYRGDFASYVSLINGPSPGSPVEK